MKNFTLERDALMESSGLKYLRWCLMFLLLISLSLTTVELSAQNVAVFLDQDYGSGENNGQPEDGTCADEDNNLEELLDGYLANNQITSLTKITDINSFNFATGLANIDVLVLPEQEIETSPFVDNRAELFNDLGSANIQAIQNWTSGGGIFITIFTESMINALFYGGSTVVSGTGANNNVDMFSINQPDVDDALFDQCGLAPTLIANNNTLVLTSTLPAGSFCFYKNGNTSPAVQIPYGFGCIRFFGWDLFNGWEDCVGGLDDSPTGDGTGAVAEWDDLFVCMLTTLKPDDEPEDCVLPCNNNVQVSLDGNCYAYILPDMILEDPTPGCTYMVEVLDQYENVIPSNPVVTIDHIGMTLKVRIINPDGNSCWGYITVEDKLGPALECLQDITVSCNDWFNELDFSDKTLTAEFGGSTTIGEDTNYGGNATTILLMEMDNVSNQILYAETGSLSIGLAYSAPGADQSVEIRLFSPDGNMVYSDVVVTSASSLNIDLTPSLQGMQTLDADFQGAWELGIVDLTPDGRVVSVNGADIAVNAIGPASDNCTGFVYETLDVDDEDHDCNFDDYSYKKIFTYQAVDDYGNESIECELHVYFERKVLVDVEFPEDVVLGCGFTAMNDWDKNGNGYPDADEAGVPTIDGNPIFPNDHFCEINVTSEDQRIEICDGQYKILRKWTALDWCQPGELREEFQIIKVGNFSGMIISSCVEDAMMFPADPYYCSTDVLLPPPTVDTKEYCSTITYTVGYLLADDNGDPPTDGVYIPTGIYYDLDEDAIVPAAPLGRTWVRYTLKDACGNLGECFTEVDVFDDIPPYPVCDQFTSVTLTQSGWAKIYAESLDDGSHDNCTEVSFAVRRMNQTCGNTSDLDYVRSYNGNDYYAFEHFCCADVGNQELMVELLVCDEFDNCNSCMVVVEVEDKIDFLINCPPNATIDCETDPQAVDANGVLLTGEPSPVVDNCGTAVITWDDVSVNIDNCGVGTIRRQWTFTLGSQVKTCTQTINVENLTPNNTVQGPANEEVNIEGCMNLDTDPSNPNIGGPTYQDDFCSLISSTYDDQVFYFADGACFKIVREWTVIDWCLFDATNGSSGLYYFNQVIKINNFEEPDFACSPLTINAQGDNCDEYVEVIAQATDDCTDDEDLVYSYVIDLFTDGVPDGSGSTYDASRVYPVGIHTIYWEVEDMCGNEKTCDQIITVLDDKNPTPYCLGGVTTVVMNDPDNSEVRIWASDFDLGSSDQCDGDNVFISFSQNTNDIYREYGCDDLGVQTVQIWVTDQSGNQDYCTTMIDVQDNMGICPDNGGGDDNEDTASNVAGRIMSESQVSVENVDVLLYNMNDDNTSELSTVTDGSFAFGELSNGMDYQLTAQKEDNYLNGVSTLDLVLIQKHILGLTTLDSPYKVIAADANNNETVSATDLIELRKLILGIYTELPDNESWRFVDAEQQFPLATTPWPLQEVITLNNLNEDLMDNNFVAVKIGDVNGNASTSVNSVEIENRNTPYYFNANNQSYQAGDLVELVVEASEAIDLLGYQFTIDFDSSLEYLGLDSDQSIDMDETNMNVKNEMNMITTSWHTANAKQIAQNQTLFTLHFRAKTNNTIANAVTFNSELINAEIYDENLSTRSVGLAFDGIVKPQNTLVVSQNRPNPFDELTQIEFSITKESDVTLKVIDLTGKLVYQTTDFFTAGTHSIVLYANQLAAKGMMYYQISTESETVTRKMLMIE